MDMETLLRISFVVSYVVMTLARLIPSRGSPALKRTRGERWKTLKQEGVLAIFSMILATYGNLIVGVLYLINSRWISWSYFHLPLPLRLAGIFLSAVSILYLYWAGRTLSESYSYTVDLQKGQSLITSGPYSTVRHPIYTGTLLFLFAQVLVSDNWLFLAILIALLPFLNVRIQKEEQMLIENFGEEYIEYMKRTGRIFPSLRTREETTAIMIKGV